MIDGVSYVAKWYIQIACSCQSACLSMHICRKLTFFKPIKICKNVNKVSLHVSANRISTKHSPTAVVWSCDIMRSEDCNFHRNQTFGRRIDHLYCLFLDLKNCAIWQLDWIKVSLYQLKCNERRLVCNEACAKLSQLVRTTAYLKVMWALIYAQQSKLNSVLEQKGSESHVIVSYF